MNRLQKGLFHYCLFLAVMLCIAEEYCFAQDMPVPVPVQVRFFRKVFAYNKSIPKEGVKVIVVYGDATGETKDEVVEAFESLGMKASAVKGGQLASAGAGAHVVYLAPGGDMRAVKEFCKNNGVLSITGMPNLARNGDISISLDAVNDAPKVIVNPDRLKLEKQDAADLMRLR
jgi:hypothetical protein